MQNTYRRVDDHATAISRLSKGIQDNMQDRPTIMHVRHLIANSLAEDRLRIIADNKKDSTRRKALP